MGSLRKTTGTVLAMQLILRRLMEIISLKGLMMEPYIFTMELAVEKSMIYMIILSTITSSMYATL